MTAPSILSTFVLGALSAAPLRSEPAVKGRGNAYMVSALGTALPLATGIGVLNVIPSAGGQMAGASLMFTGLFLGPSTGQGYVGSWGHAIAGSALRATGGILAITGTSRLRTLSHCDPEYSDCSGKAGAATRLAAGTLLFVGGTAYSLIQTAQATRPRSRTAATPSLQVGPLLALAPAGGLISGLQASWRF